MNLQILVSMQPPEVTAAFSCRIDLGAAMAVMLVGQPLDSPEELGSVFIMSEKVMVEVIICMSVGTFLCC